MSWRIPIIETLDNLKKYLEDDRTNPVDFKLKIKDFYYDLPSSIPNTTTPTSPDLSWYRDSIEKLIERIKKIEHIHHEKNFVSYDRLLERMEKLEDERFENIATVHKILERIEKLEGRINSDFYTEQSVVAITQRLGNRIEKIEEKIEGWDVWRIETKRQIDNIIPGSERLDRFEERIKKMEIGTNYVDYMGLLRRVEKLDELVNRRTN